MPPPAAAVRSAIRFTTFGISSSGIAKITAIGCNCVITASPVVSVACTMLPKSTSRSPMRPVIGAVILL